MMSVSMRENNYYTLNDFENIIHNGLEYSLPIHVIHNIQNIQNTCQLQNNQNNENKKRVPTLRTIGINKPPIETFKITPSIREEKSELDKDISIIRISLNKITAKNYNNQRDLIFKTIEPYVNDNDIIQKIANIIFEISSSNPFLSELNAQLYKELINKYNIFHNIVFAFIEEYQNSFKYVERTTEQPIEIRNKLNDKRKAMSGFIIYLMKQDIISKEFIISLVYKLFDKIFNYIEQKNLTYEVEEIVENLFIILSKSYNILSSLNEWNDIYYKISILGEMKPSGERPSITNRAIFKFEELLDKI